MTIASLGLDCLLKSAEITLTGGDCFGTPLTFVAKSLTAGQVRLVVS
jgi:hypothetical protein